MSELSVDLNNFGRRTEVALRATAQLTLYKFNAYDIMTQTSNVGNKEKQERLRKTCFEYCGITTSKKESEAGEKEHAVCMLTGKAGILKLAHLLPVSAKNYVKRMLAIADECSIS
jgi:hypothetical protein